MTRVVSGSLRTIFASSSHYKIPCYNVETLTLRVKSGLRVLESELPVSLP